MKKKYTYFDIIPFLPFEREIANEHLADILTLDKLVSTIPGDKDGLTFVDHKRLDQQDLIEKSQSRIIICSEAIQLENSLKDKLIIKVKYPKLVFSIIGNALFTQKPVWGIHPTAIVHPEAEIHRESHIGPHTYIGKSRIGKHTVIYGNTHIYDSVEIGSNVLVYAGCVLGSEGYGYNRDETGFPIQFPHIGRIILEDYVELGSNSTIDLGALKDTIIGWGSKIDNLVHIGHNVVIGRCCHVAACTSIAGSSHIGDYTDIWTGVRISNNIDIGAQAFIGIGSVVINDIPSGKKCFGNPARVIGNASD